MIYRGIVVLIIDILLLTMSENKVVRTLATIGAVCEIVAMWCYILGV